MCRHWLSQTLWLLGLERLGCRHLHHLPCGEKRCELSMICAILKHLPSSTRSWWFLFCRLFGHVVGIGLAVRGLYVSIARVRIQCYHRMTIEWSTLLRKSSSDLAKLALAWHFSWTCFLLLTTGQVTRHWTLADISKWHISALQTLPGQWLGTMKWMQLIAQKDRHCVLSVAIARTAPFGPHFTTASFCLAEALLALSPTKL